MYVNTIKAKYKNLMNYFEGIYKNITIIKNLNRQECFLHLFYQNYQAQLF